MFDHIETLGQLKASGYISKSIKDELRDNLIHKIKSKAPVFEGIFGFEDTVIPDIERAILSRHNILLLGLRGQAKTKLARLLITLLDEYIPYVKGSELCDDPLQPMSRFAIDLIEKHGDETPIAWLHRNERYFEKLATPDVSVADLIGDVDPIKAANLKLSYADEQVIHFGMIPRANRSIFVINELPDLQARIQVSLFNVLQEGDIQIRGFKLRLPLDINFVFTANPEDYTNRGSIITPLKDRIESQILTHYPTEIDISKRITLQEANLTKTQIEAVYVPDVLHEILERISFVARESEFVDLKSGVSARLSISAYENLVSAAERRMLMNNETKTTARLTDFWGIIPAITGKIELVYEGEQEGPYEVALSLIDKAIKDQFLIHFPDPNKIAKKDSDPYSPLKMWFNDGNTVDLLNDATNENYQTTLDNVAGLRRVIKQHNIKADDSLIFMELILNGLTEFEVLSKEVIDNKVTFKDMLADMFKGGFDDDNDDEDNDY